MEEDIVGKIKEEKPKVKRERERKRVIVIGREKEGPKGV